MDGSIKAVESKKSVPTVPITVRCFDGSVLENPDIYPPGTQFRLCSVVMALGGAVGLFSEINNGGDQHCGVAGILDLAVAELTRINTELEATRGC
jgi:hypothetical protein